MEREWNHEPTQEHGALQFRETVRLDIQEIARRLNKALGAVLVSQLAGAGSAKASTRWAQPEGTNPRPEARQRLLFAYGQLKRIERQENAEVARNWFIGLNPWLDYENPVTAIREGNFKKVVQAVTNLLDDSNER